MLTVYEKPTCSTSRKLRELLDARGVAYRTVDYYREPFTAETLGALLTLAAITPREALRTRGGIARAHGVTDTAPADAELLALMAANPDLIQRPIAAAGDRAVLARPVERALELL